MYKPFCLIVLLPAAALLLSGCGGNENTTEQSQDIKPETDLADNGPYNIEERVIPVAGAERITTLRKEAAAENKVLVIDCWATWCGSCVAMFPHLHQAMKERGDDVMLVSLSFDEGEGSIKKAEQFLTEQDAWHNAYVATPGSDAKDRIAQALSVTWDGGALPAVFVYKPDGTIGYQMLETRGEVKDWVASIAQAVDQALQTADDSPGQ